MSVYVKGMEMPDDCRECPFETYYNHCGITKCRATGKDLAVDWKCIPWEGRAEWCPMVEVPTPHGRLIDGSELVVKYDLYAPIAPVVEGDSEHWTNLIHTKHILTAPTIIEAEDE